MPKRTNSPLLRTGVQATRPSGCASGTSSEVDGAASRIERAHRANPNWLGFGLAHEIVAAHKLSADLQTAHRRGRLHNRAHRGDAGAMNITIAEVTAAQSSATRSRYERRSARGRWYPLAMTC